MVHSGPQVFFWLWPPIQNYQFCSDLRLHVLHFVHVSTGKWQRYKKLLGSSLVLKKIWWLCLFVCLYLCVCLIGFEFVFIFSFLSRIIRYGNIWTSIVLVSRGGTARLSQHRSELSRSPPISRTQRHMAGDLTLLGKSRATHSKCSRSKAGSSIKCPGDLWFVKHLFAIFKNEPSQQYGGETFPYTKTLHLWHNIWQLKYLVKHYKSYLWQAGIKMKCPWDLLSVKHFVASYHTYLAIKSTSRTR